jgi:hypothetical protein
MSNHYFTPDVDRYESSDEDYTCAYCGEVIKVGEPVVQFSQKVGIFAGNYMVEHDYVSREFHPDCYEDSLEDPYPDF